MHQENLVPLLLVQVLLLLILSLWGLTFLFFTSDEDVSIHLVRFLARKQSRNVSYHCCFCYLCSWMVSHVVSSSILVVNLWGMWVYVTLLRISAILYWWYHKVVHWFAQGHSNRSWDLNPEVIVQNSLVEISLVCTLLPWWNQTLIVLWRPKLEFRELEESPMRMDFKDQ